MMTFDPELVEMVAVTMLAVDEAPNIHLQDAIAHWSKHWPEMRVAEHDGDCTKKPFTCMRCLADTYRQSAATILSAINASGTHVVAPVVATEEMIEEGASAYHEADEAHRRKDGALFPIYFVPPIWSAMLAAAREGK